MKIGDKVIIDFPMDKYMNGKKVKIIGFAFRRKDRCCIKFKNGRYDMISKYWLKKC